MSNILKQYRVAGEDKNVRVINSNSMIKQIFADSISRPADSYTGISSDAQSSLEKTKSLSPDTQESGFNDGINAAVVTEIDVSAEKERLLEEAKLEADSILDKAKAEASRLLDEAKQRAQILYADNKSKGYEDGLAECQREFDEKGISLRQELSDKESALKSKYDAYSKELESDLIDAIIQVFNKVFKIQFDDKKDILLNVKFETYASLRIRGAILDQIRKMDWIPRTVRQRQRKIDEAIKNIELRTGKTANDADLAKELSISEDELCSWQSQLKVTNVVSLDEFDESGPEPVMDAAHNSHYAQPEEIVTQEELKTMLVKSLDNLTEKERRVIELYYYEDLTLKEISNILEVSESRVSQLHTKGLIKMRKVMGPYMNILTNA